MTLGTTRRMGAARLRGPLPACVVAALIAVSAAACGGERLAEGPGTGADSVGATGGADSRRPAASDTIGGAAAAPAVEAGLVPDDCRDLHATLLRAAPTREAFAAAFGEPESIHRDSEPNRHVEGAVDSLFTVRYPGFLMHIRTPRGGRDMADHIMVRDNRYLAWPGIGIGVAAERIEAVLGTPTRREPGALTYDCSEHVEQPVTFRLAGGVVEAIEVAFYVD
jgi:hypothetical protein